MAEKQQYTELQFGFDIRTGSLVDRRTVLSYEEMIKGEVVWNGMTIPLKNILPDRYIVLCRGADTPTYAAVNRRFKGKLFVYDSELTHEGDNYRIPLGGSDTGLFTLVTNPIDVVDVDGNSLADQQTGLVTIYDPDGTRIEDAEQRLETAETNITDLQDTKVDYDQLDELVDGRLEHYQRRTYLYGSGDYLDSEGFPHPKSGVDGFGVHVDIQKHDDEPWTALIDHTAVVPAGGWVSKYAVGGVAVGQAFMEGTKIDDVLKQLFEGDPKTDNVVCYIEYNKLPTSNMYWTDTAWRQTPTKRDVLLRDGIELEVHPDGQYVLIALPIAMIREQGQTPDEYPVELKEIYNKDAAAFTYAFNYVDIKNSSVASEVGYRVYYLLRPVSGNQTLKCEFKRA